MVDYIYSYEKINFKQYNISFISSLYDWAKTYDIAQLKAEMLTVIQE